MEPDGPPADSIEARLRAIAAADMAYDTNANRRLIAERGARATIPPLPRRNEPIPYDRDSYARRHLVENYFADLKQFRGVATRYCQLAERFRSMVYLAA